MAVSFAPPPLLALPEKPHERRFTVALLCSGIFHAALAAVITTAFALHAPLGPPPSTDRPSLIAVLQPPRVVPDTVVATSAPDPVVLPEPDRAPAVMAVPQPAAALPLAAPTPAPRALPAPVRGPITSSDPNGNVTVGMVEEPAILGPGVAAGLANRYPTRIDKPPRMLGAMIVPYPPAAREAHASARIAAVLDVDDHGRIGKVSLVPEHAWFGPAVLDALKDARFMPAELATNPVPYWAIVEFVFAIAPAISAPASSGGTPERQAGAEAGGSVN